MIRRIVLTFSLSLLLFAALPVIAWAWGSATHAYFAKELAEEGLAGQEIYGATAPDLFNTLFSLPSLDYLVKQTHYRFVRLKRSACEEGGEGFAFGFVSHNERWGADFTAHRNGRTTDRGYVIRKSEALAPRLRPAVQAILEAAGVPLPSIWAGQLAPALAHPFIETAIDLLIRRNEDPPIGMELIDSATRRAASVPDLLVSAYAGGLARNSGLSYEEAAAVIRDSEEEFQQLMVRYGEILAMSEPEAIQALAEQGAFLIESYLGSILGEEVTVPREVLTDMLNLAIAQVEADYGEEIEATLSYLKGRKGISNYLRRIVPHSCPE
jgi:hypothetical protein